MYVGDLTPGESFEYHGENYRVVAYASGDIVAENVSTGIEYAFDPTDQIGSDLETQDVKLYQLNIGDSFILNGAIYTVEAPIDVFSNVGCERDGKRYVFQGNLEVIYLNDME